MGQLAAILYKLVLPHVEIASLDAKARRQCLGAIHATDYSDLGPLTDLRVHRIAGAI